MAAATQAAPAAPALIIADADKCTQNVDLIVDVTPVQDVAPKKADTLDMMMEKMKKFSANIQAWAKLYHAGNNNQTENQKVTAYCQANKVALLQVLNKMWAEFDISKDDIATLRDRCNDLQLNGPFLICAYAHSQRA